eukprot:CAMPEP_0194267314 /NCGR_PEP_ID=MMETSP0169-20130528/1869_1 /TAXON_ID=218684 /ORGANISM="Corethron pennatum, Strain L29A3" /LENGTH=38 /DNA_ID= /DNA_START= /DNA_END= /DNA_ORIENTATION=
MAKLRMFSVGSSTDMRGTTHGSVEMDSVALDAAVAAAT